MSRALRWTQDELRSTLDRLGNKPAKYHNRKTAVDNIVFDSKKEAGRYIELKLMQQAGQITDLHLQQVFNLDVNGITVGHYIADFTYRHKEWPGLIVEDVKSPATRTALYQLKKKIFQAQYGITITET